METIGKEGVDSNRSASVRRGSAIQPLNEVWVYDVIVNSAVVVQADGDKTTRDLVHSNLFIPLESRNLFLA